MAADAWLFYQSFREWMGDGTIDMDTDEFYMALFLSASNCTTLTHDEYGDLDEEVATAFGYTQLGEPCTATITNANQWLRAGASVMFDCDNVVWTAAGGSIVCRYAVIYDTTHATNALVCYSLLDNAPANITCTTGNTLTITINVAGVFTLT
jgi:hypothetical protein